MSKKELINELIFSELGVAALRVIEGAKRTAVSPGVGGGTAIGAPDSADEKLKYSEADAEKQPESVGSVEEALRTNPNGLVDALGKQLDEHAASDQRLLYGVLGLMGLIVLVVLLLAGYTVLSNSDQKNISAVAAITTTMLGAISAHMIKPQQLFERMDISRRAVLKFKAQRIIYEEKRQLEDQDSAKANREKQAAEEFVKCVLSDN